MSLLSNPDLLRRARPWLGTLVEVAAVSSLPTSERWSECAARAIESAFTAIARVHASMSFQTETSELSQYNRLEPGQWLPVSADLLGVLAFSTKLSEQTQGVFDVCCTGGDWRAIELDLSSQRASKSAPMTMDLSGVAKGYAVDCGVHALLAGGIESGWINAGGDVRVFGVPELPLQVRSPTNAFEFYDCGLLHQSAAATSASYLLAEPVLRQGASRQLLQTPASWTVRAPTCMVADALTKVLAATHQVHHPVFKQYGAQGWIID